ncbi:MAG TPA: carbonic anhydrase [Caulobacteraceae bacterium]|jgi:carbonic anhydrase
MFDFKGKKKAFAGAGAPPPPPGGGDEPPRFSGTLDVHTPDEALAALKSGNAAFCKGEGVINRVSAKDFAELQEGQKPFAIIVACADSRTPPTLLFNQGLGRLFIVRVAGNTVDRRGLASIVYAVKYLKAPLVVVLGHTGCGAVGLAQAVVEGRAELEPALEEMVTPIIPAVLHVKARSHGGDITVASVEENARHVANGLKTADTTIAAALNSGALKIVAAVKDIKTGAVNFLDGA